MLYVCTLPLQSHCLPSSSSSVSLGFPVFWLLSDLIWWEALEKFWKERGEVRILVLPFIAHEVPSNWLHSITVGHCDTWGAGTALSNCFSSQICGTSPPPLGSSTVKVPVSLKFFGDALCHPQRYDQLWCKYTFLTSSLFPTWILTQARAVKELCVC